MKYYNRSNTCDICGISFDKIGWNHPVREYNNEGNWTGKWLCNKCHSKFSSNSKSSLIKSITNRRTDNLNPNSTQTIGDNFEELTCIWKKVKILNKENNCYNGPLDHSADSEGIIYQTKGRFYSNIEKRWGFGGLDAEWDKTFDYEICYCASKDGKIIERIYEFPKEEIECRKSIGIYKKPSNRNGRCPIKGWYEKYIISDKETLKKVNDIWKKILEKK